MGQTTDAQHFKTVHVSVWFSDMWCGVLPSPTFPSPDFLGSQEDVELAVGAARKAYESWSKLPGDVRARHMYSIARRTETCQVCRSHWGSFEGHFAPHCFRKAH